MHYYTGLIDFEFRHGALLSVGLGWLITSESAKSFFEANEFPRIFATLAVLTLTFLHAFWVYKFYMKSKRAYNMLLELEFLPAAYFDDQRIQPYLALTFSSVHFIFSVVICTLLWTF